MQKTSLHVRRQVLSISHNTMSLLIVFFAMVSLFFVHSAEARKANGKYGPVVHDSVRYRHHQVSSLVCLLEEALQQSPRQRVLANVQLLHLLLSATLICELLIGGRHYRQLATKLSLQEKVKMVILKWLHCY